VKWQLSVTPVQYQQKLGLIDQNLSRDQTSQLDKTLDSFAYDREFLNCPILPLRLRMFLIGQGEIRLFGPETAN